MGGSSTAGRLVAQLGEPRPDPRACGMPSNEPLNVAFMIA
jgi:hypothetical protein